MPWIILAVFALLFFNKNGSVSTVFNNFISKLPKQPLATERQPWYTPATAVTTNARGNSGITTATVVGGSLPSGPSTVTGSPAVSTVATVPVVAPPTTSPSTPGLTSAQITNIGKGVTQPQ